MKGIISKRIEWGGKGVPDDYKEAPLSHCQNTKLYIFRLFEARKGTATGNLS